MPIPEWEEEYALCGQKHQVACHTFGGGAERSRLLFVSPHIAPVTLTQAPLDVMRQTTALRNGGERNPNLAACPFTPLPARPATCRAVAARMLERNEHSPLTGSEARTLMSWRYLAKDGTKKFAGPAEFAQWLTIPVDLASAMLGRELQPTESIPLVGCTNVIDDLTGRDSSAYAHMPEQHRPPEHRYHVCGVKRLCLQCGDLSRVLGKGWHTKALASHIAPLLLQAVKIRLNALTTQDPPAQFTPFRDVEEHNCGGHMCRFKMTLGQAKAKRAKVGRPDDLFYV